MRSGSSIPVRSEVVVVQSNSPRANLAKVGAVVIGRDEGDRLRRCLESVVGVISTVVYVDSGSTDASVALAESLGITVVELDTSKPFSAGRARNAGDEKLLELVPDLEYIQFVDGDCSVVDAWWEAAIETLECDPQIVAVCGRQMEINRNETIFNRMIDIEWDTPIGVAKSCGGCTMYRVAAFRDVGRFNPAVVAGEEPELCVRLKQQGGVIQRIDQEMTWHDAEMSRFSQWWTRNVRAGHAYAQGNALHGKPPTKYRQRELRRIWFWALVLPMVIAGLAALTKGWGLVLLSAYLVQAIRVWRDTHRKGNTQFDSAIYSLFTVLAKWPQLVGHWKFGSRLGLTDATGS